MTCIPCRDAFEQDAIRHLIVQQTPVLRRALGRMNRCDACDVPVRLPAGAGAQARAR